MVGTAVREDTLGDVLHRVHAASREVAWMHKRESFLWPRDGFGGLCSGSASQEAARL